MTPNISMKNFDWDFVLLIFWNEFSSAVFRFITFYEMKVDDWTWILYSIKQVHLLKNPFIDRYHNNNLIIHMFPIHLLFFKMFKSRIPFQAAFHFDARAFFLYLFLQIEFEHFFSISKFYDFPTLLIADIVWIFRIGIVFFNDWQCLCDWHSHALGSLNWLGLHM